MRRIVTSLAIAITGVIGTGTAQAKQFTKHIAGKEVVVHTNPLPVVLHRMVPPQHGKHVTAKEVEMGRLPSTTTNSSSQDSGLLRQRRSR
jgi:hypothetical protein